MKTKYYLAAGVAISAAMAFIGVAAMTGIIEKGLSAKGTGTAAKKWQTEKSSDYTTYETELGDYRIIFDFPKGLQSAEPIKAMGVESQDFYSDNMDFITITTVPAKWNADDSRPRNAADYVAYRKKNQGEYVISEDINAEDYRTGDFYGIKYTDMTEYSFGKAYVMGYEIFHGDDYMYIFVQRNDRMPAEIKKLKIRKK